MPVDRLLLARPLLLAAVIPGMEFLRVTIRVTKSSDEFFD